MQAETALLQAMTKRISSPATRFYKRIFPILWFGFVVGFALLGVYIGLKKGLWVLMVVPTVLAAVGYAVMKSLIRDLVDEVYDGGDHLLVRLGDIEERLPLTNVMNVSASTGSSPPRITLRLAKPGNFGQEITFVPVRARSLSPFARIPFVDDLIVRVDRARSRRSV